MGVVNWLRNEEDLHYHKETSHIQDEAASCRRGLRIDCLDFMLHLGERQALVCGCFVNGTIDHVDVCAHGQLFDDSRGPLDWCTFPGHHRAFALRWRDQHTNGYFEG